MASEREQLEVGIAALEAQRAILGDAVVETMLAPIRARLAALSGPPAAPPPAVQQLKQVTVLFLDIVGSTTLSQHLDPEDIHAVLDDALASGTTIVDAHGGRVLQYAGDNLLAAFGVDEAREDDSERAVRCGLALLALGRVLGPQVKAKHGHDGFDLRVGVHTGGVLLGGGVDAEGTIRGIAVNIAARMEQTAPAGVMRISHDTYSEVRGLFEVVAQEPLQVKGVDEPVQSYFVTKAKPRSFRIGTRGIEGVATRMIGRRVELEALQASFMRLFAERRFAAITVTADAGIGKSRLLYEFEAWSEARPETFFIFRGRATPQTQGQPFGLLRDVFAWRFRIADDDTLDEARRKMEEGIVPLFVDDDGAEVAEGNAHVLGHLIGIEWRDSPHVKGILDDPKQIRMRAFHVAAEFFRRVNRRSGPPIVLQLDDLHWCDSETLDFLAYLSDVGRDIPLFVLACSRPTLFERRPRWCADELHARLDLRALDKDDSRDLVNELLKKMPEVPAALRELVSGGSEGNPFYMEELVKMLIDQRAIEIGDVWKVNAERLLVTKVPSTLTGILQARLDGLPEPERVTLQEASVIGQVFWDQALIALDDQAKTTLPSLVARELALPRDDAVDEDLVEYAFKHAILHQVTYATLLKRTKKSLHGKLANWLAAQTGLRANDFLGIAACHFEEAGDDASAAEFHARAAEQATTRLAHEAVLSHVGRALVLLDRTPDSYDRTLRWRLLRCRETTHDLQGNREAQRADLDAMAVLADAMDDDGRRAHAAWRMGDLLQRVADYAGCEAAARRAVALAAAVDDRELRLTAQRLVAIALVRRGDSAAAKEVAEAALAEARAFELRRVEGTCLNALLLIAGAQGDYAATPALARQSLLANEAVGNRRNEAIARANLGVALLELGSLAQARDETEEALRDLRANGDRAMECALLGNLSVLAFWEGHAARSLQLAEKSLETAIAGEDRLSEVIALCRIGDAALAGGERSRARDAFARAHERAKERKLPHQYEASAGLARVALADGDGRGAIAALADLLRLDDEEGAMSRLLDGVEAQRQVELTCYRVLSAAADPRAAKWLRRAYDAVEGQARRIADPGLRTSYLENIPWHREIVAAMTAHPDSSAATLAASA